MYESNNYGVKVKVVMMKAMLLQSNKCGFVVCEPCCHMHVAVCLLIKTLTYRPRQAVDIVTTSMYVLNEYGDRGSNPF